MTWLPVNPTSFLMVSSILGNQAFRDDPARTMRPMLLKLPMLLPTLTFLSSRNLLLVLAWLRMSAVPPSRVVLKDHAVLQAMCYRRSRDRSSLCWGEAGAHLIASAVSPA
jgi:hypothetical protein